MSTKVMQEQIADYFKTQPVLKAWLFGSYSRGEQKPWSDVDILVLTKCQTPCEVLFLPKLFVFLKKIVYLQQNVRIHYEQCRLLGFHPFHHC